VGLYLGFTELVRAGFAKSVPRLAPVQAACDPIYRAWAADEDDVQAVEKADTAAEGISVAKPVRGRTILQALRESGGYATTVTDEEVWDMLQSLGGLGLYVEPTAAAAPAAFLRLRRQGAIPAGPTVVVIADEQRPEGDGSNRAALCNRSQRLRLTHAARLYSG